MGVTMKHGEAGKREMENGKGEKHAGRGVTLDTKRCPRWRWSLVPLLSVGLAVTAAAARPITHEDLWRMPRLSPPVISPDGLRAVVPVLQPAYDEADQRSDLWLLDVSGQTPPRQLTFDAAVESSPVWTPDSASLVYVKKVEATAPAQLYRLNLGGGEAVQLTTLSTGARSPQISPDGRQLLYVSTVDPRGQDDAEQKALADERKARKYNVRVYTGFPVRNWDKWLDERQTHLYVQPLKPGADARDLLAGTELARQPGFSGRVSDTGEELDAVFTPDSRSIVFVAGINRHRAAYANTNTDLYLVALTGGEPRRLTGQDSLDAGPSWAKPRFSPDGALLWALHTPISAYSYNATRAAALRWPALTQLPLIAGPDGRAISSFVPDADGKTLWFTAEDSGRERLYRAQVGQSAAEAWIALEHGAYTNLSGADRARSTTLIAGYDSATQPMEIVRIDTRQREHQPLTRFSSERVRELDLAPAEDLWVEAAGRRVHSLVIKPPGFDPARKYPLLVLIHGGPNIQWRDQFFLRWNYHLLAAPGYVVLLTNYKGSTGYGEAFAQSIHLDPFVCPADDLNRAADAAIERLGYIDASRQCAGGASYGGHLANWLQGTTTRYRCLISHAGLVNLEAQWGTSDTIYGREVSAGGPPWAQGPVWREQNPIRLATAWRTPVLVTVGEQDFRVPLNNTLEYWSALQRMQIESRLLVFPDENHWIQKGENSRYYYQEVADWLARWLK